MAKSSANHSLFVPHAHSTAFASHLSEGINSCLLLLFDSKKENCLKRARKKQAKRERLLKKMKSRGKWKHGKSNVEKVRRLKEAKALLANVAP